MDGILIIALGHELYAKFAYNNALTCFDSNENIPITIVTEESCISAIRIEDLKAIGVNFVYVNTDDCLIDGVKNYQLFKLKMFDLSPYDRTLYLDADTIINSFKDIGDIFGKCTNKDFQPLVAGLWHNGDKRIHGKKYTHWCKDVNQIYAYHKLSNPVLYQTQTSAICFNKSQKAKEIFKVAYGTYLDKNLPSIKWAGGYPDEYCINVALSLLDEKIIYPFTPIHCVNTNGEMTSFNILRERFYGMSMAGTKFTPIQHKLYDVTANMSFNNLIKVKGVLPEESRPYPLIELEKRIIEVRKKF
jgi:hypothetical protein